MSCPEIGLPNRVRSPVLGDVRGARDLQIPGRDNFKGEELSDYICRYQNVVTNLTALSEDFFCHIDARERMLVKREIGMLDAFSGEIPLSPALGADFVTVWIEVQRLVRNGNHKLRHSFHHFPGSVEQGTALNPIGSKYLIVDIVGYEHRVEFPGAISPEFMLGQFSNPERIVLYTSLVAVRTHLACVESLFQIRIVRFRISDSITAAVNAIRCGQQFLFCVLKYGAIDQGVPLSKKLQKLKEGLLVRDGYSLGTGFDLDTEGLQELKVLRGPGCVNGIYSSHYLSIYRYVKIAIFRHISKITGVTTERRRPFLGIVSYP